MNAFCRAELSVEELTRPEDLESLRAEWIDLYRRSSRATPFQTAEWIIAWCRHFGCGSIFSLTVRHRGRLVAVAPWLVYEHAARRRVAFLAGGVSDYHDVLVEAGSEEAASLALLSHLDRRSAAWDECSFERLGRRSVLREAQLPPDWVDDPSEGDPCPELEIPDPAVPLSLAVPPRQLARLRKYRRRVERTGRLLLERAEGDQRIVALEELLQMNAARWSSHPSAPPSLAAHTFHREVVSRLGAEGCRAELHRLTLDGRTMAILYGLVSGRTFYCYMQGFDPALADMSPGALLVGAVLEHAHRSGMNVVDFLRGTEPYKLAWGGRPSSVLTRRFVRRK
jgi:CelD/BcsL family acetyltransferase involved in cellulose biosynthesis